MGSPNGIYKWVLVESILMFDKFRKRHKKYMSRCVVDSFEDYKNYKTEQLQDIVCELYKADKALMTFSIGYMTGKFFESCNNDELNAIAAVMSDIYELVGIDI